LKKVKPGYKIVKWLFGKEIEIPEDWEYVKIGKLVSENKILEIQDGNHGEIHPKKSDFVETGIPFITSDCLIMNKIDFSICNFLPKKFLKILRIGFTQKDDVLLSHKGSIGYSAIVDDEFKTLILTPQTTYYRLSEDILPGFLYYVFQSYHFQTQLKSLAKQSTRDYIGITNQQHLLVPYLTSKKEQEKIVSILSNIDNLIDIHQKILGKFSENKSNHDLRYLEKLKKGLMQKLLTGQIRVKYD
jgi:type I restriction enzyme, S subunit